MSTGTHILMARIALYADTDLDSDNKETTVFKFCQRNSHVISYKPIFIRQKSRKPHNNQIVNKNLYILNI